MARHRSYSRSRSRSPTRRKRYDDPRDRRRERRSPSPTSLLVRNISLSARPEDLRVHFERFGPLKDVYLPKDYYTGEPRGFGFLKFRHPEDAAEAKSQLNRTVIGGREIRIVFAEENRKTPQEMHRISRVSSRGSYRRRSPSLSPRRRYRSYSCSPSPARHDLRSLSDKERHKESTTNKRNGKRDHKVKESCFTFLSMPLQKFIVPISSWITFKFCGIMFIYAFGLEKLLYYVGRPTHLLKKECKAYVWPKNETIFKEAKLSMLLPMVVKMSKKR